MTRQDRVAERAHEIWEREGRPEGRQEQHWEQAIREVENEDAVKAQVSVQEPITPPGEPEEGRDR